MGSNNKVKMLSTEELEALPIHRIAAYYQKLTRVGYKLKVDFKWIKCLAQAHRLLVSRSLRGDPGHRSLRHKKR